LRRLAVETADSDEAAGQRSEENTKERTKKTENRETKMSVTRNKMMRIIGFLSKMTGIFSKIKSSSLHATRSR
jgi:hypothetical protein